MGHESQHSKSRKSRKPLSAASPPRESGITGRNELLPVERAADADVPALFTPVTPTTTPFPEEPTRPRVPTRPGALVLDRGLLDDADAVTEPRGRVITGWPTNRGGATRSNVRSDGDPVSAFEAPLFVQEIKVEPASGGQEARARRPSSASRPAPSPPDHVALGWSIALALAAAGAVLGWLVLTFR